MAMFNDFFAGSSWKPTSGGYGMGGQPGQQANPQADAQAAAMRNREAAYKLAQRMMNQAAPGQRGGSSSGASRAAMPFDAARVGDLKAGSADQAARAAGARAQMMQDGLAAGGGSTADPSFRSAQVQNLGQQQGDVQDAFRGIDLTAAQSNFNAQQQAQSRQDVLEAQRQQQYLAAMQNLQNMLTSEQFGPGMPAGITGGLPGGGGGPRPGGSSMGRR